MKRIRLGNGCGFWGDSLDAPIRLAELGQLDYLTLEYLAELTMSILALLRQRDPQAGYATDFLDVLKRLKPTLVRQPNLKLITNAGGMNPLACATAAKQIYPAATIGVVSGDDLFPKLDELLTAGNTLNHLDTGAPLSTVRQRVVSANAYLGSAPIAEALGRGANIVVTGRVADACLTVGPCLHEFGWATDDWNRRSAATTAGHLIECGAQATGGLWMNADESTHLENVGYPIAEIEKSGDFTISKPPNTGGAVNRETIAEQLLYEVGDPAAYLTPDVTADFTAPRFAEVAPDTVRCTGAKGLPASDSYKVSIAYRDGFAAAGMLVLIGPKSRGQARRSGEILLERLQRSGVTFEQSHIEVLGSGDALNGLLGSANPPEVVLRVAVRDPDRANVERFTKEFAPLVTSGYAGTTGYTTGRPVTREVFAYWPALIAKSAIAPVVTMLD